jgi:hypothetical protein
MTQSVVRLTLGGILERVVGLSQSRKLGGRARVVVAVRMVLLDHLPERVPDLVLRGVIVDAEQFVKISRHITAVTCGK